MEIKTLTATQYLDIDSGETLQRIPWQITQEASADTEEVVLLEGNQAFPLTATADEIREFLTRTLAVYQEDHARHEEAKERQAALDTAAQVAEEISNISIK